MADGTKLTIDKKISKLVWWTQGHQFTSDARVLPVGCYDLILGMDWLEQFSPTWVDWRGKKMGFTYNGTRITLSGIKDCTSKCPPLKLAKFKGLLKKGGIAQLVHLSRQEQSHSVEHVDTPQEIQDLIQQHAHLIQEPKLPP